MAHTPSKIMTTADKKTAIADLKPLIATAKESKASAAIIVKTGIKSLKNAQNVIDALTKDIELGTGAKATLKTDDLHWKKQATLELALTELPANKEALKAAKLAFKEATKQLKLDEKALATAEKELANLVTKKDALK